VTQGGQLLAASVSLSSEQRSIRASLAAHEMHARHDSREITANARTGFLTKFLREVDDASPGLPEAERLRRAEHLLRAHMKRLALASSRARSKKAAPDE
jgi:predicted ATPase